MGSFQQISIGIMCLVAAFAFGNYVNNHPPGEHPRDAAAATDPSVRLSGNIQSRLVGEIELTEKRAANIATMRSRLEPRFAMPSSTSNPGLNDSTKVGSLPPPSQLDFNQGRKKGPPTIVPNDQMTRVDALESPLLLEHDDGSAVIPRVAKASDVPDFSSIMNELEGTSIALQQMGNMPQHSTPPQDRTAHAIVKPKTENRAAPLADLANEFKTAVSQSAPESAQPWDSRQSSDFTAEDFAPRLKDTAADVRAGPSSQTAAVISRRPETSSADPLSTAARYQTAAENSNRVVSREPIPSLGNSRATLPPLVQNTGGSSARLAHINSTIQPERATPADNPISILNRPSNIAPTTRQSTTKIPFALNDQGKRQLAELRSRASSQLALNTTRYVDHVIQKGETLQSISKRYFGNPEYYLDIYLANREKLRNPVSLETGVAIRIPIYE